MEPSNKFGINKKGQIEIRIKDTDKKKKKLSF